VITPDIARQIVAMSGEIKEAYDLYHVHCEGHDEDMQRTKELEKRISALEQSAHGHATMHLPVAADKPARLPPGKLWNGDGMIDGPLPAAQPAGDDAEVEALRQKFARTCGEYDAVIADLRAKLESANQAAIRQEDAKGKALAALAAEREKSHQHRLLHANEMLHIEGRLAAMTEREVKAEERAERLAVAVNANDEVQQGLRDEIIALKQSREMLLADADKRRERLAAELRLAGEQLHAAKTEVKRLEKLLGVTGREGQA
jgi:nitrate reductase NapAB chaperone NapD